MTGRTRIAAAAGLSAFLLGPGASRAFLPNAPGPVWKVILRVEAAGDYRMESTRGRTDGSFSLDFEWTGTIEKDEEDFLLVHTAGGLKSWRIEERASAGDSSRVQTEADVEVKPELKVGYVLRDKDQVRFSFIVEGFDVPLAGSGEAFPLVLPVSAEGGRSSGTVAYGSGIRKGSNDVSVEAAKLASGPVEKTFGWTWRRQAWVQLEDVVVFQANGHTAKVTLSISPL
jgi:hypothetical protein